mmetsp:Transcript_30923/g.82942  ORF Transcript_30923/g.82942 Transcript_30923/m.82942 type:complete len:345 (+) Transcript_30923:349-1383(+)
MLGGDSGMPLPGRRGRVRVNRCGETRVATCSHVLTTRRGVDAAFGAWVHLPPVGGEGAGPGLRPLAGQVRWLHPVEMGGVCIAAVHRQRGRHDVKVVVGDDGLQSHAQLNLGWHGLPAVDGKASHSRRPHDLPPAVQRPALRKLPQRDGGAANDVVRRELVLVVHHDHDLAVRPQRVRVVHHLPIEGGRQRGVPHPVLEARAPTDLSLERPWRVLQEDDGVGVAPAPEVHVRQAAHLLDDDGQTKSKHVRRRQRRLRLGRHHRRYRHGLVFGGLPDHASLGNAARVLQLQALEELLLLESQLLLHRHHGYGRPVALHDATQRGVEKQVLRLTGELGALFGEVLM